MTQHPLTIGVFLFPDFEMLDVYGPLEMYGCCQGAFRIVTVAAEKGLVAPHGGGPETRAVEGFDTAPQFDVLMVPGGWGSFPLNDDARALDWVRQQAKGAQFVTSVCSGSMTLAAAGLLEGRKATTNKMWFDRIKGLYPAVDWQPKARWVVDGNTYTSSGISAGTDMACQFIEDRLGAEMADRVTRVTEYRRDTNPDNDPFAADQ